MPLIFLLFSWDIVYFLNLEYKSIDQSGLCTFSIWNIKVLTEVALKGEGEGGGGGGGGGVVKKILNKKQ